MVTKVTIKNISDEVLLEKHNEFFNNLFDYYENKGINIRSLILINEDEEFEYIYLFLDSMDLKFFLNNLIENDIEILHQEDYTDKLLDIIKSNKLEEFMQKFVDLTFLEEVIRNFIINNVTKDIILDKMLDFGKESLNQLELEILNS